MIPSTPFGVGSQRCGLSEASEVIHRLEHDRRKVSLMTQTLKTENKQLESTKDKGGVK